jgi:hypothetical protein
LLLARQLALQIQKGGLARTGVTLSLPLCSATPSSLPSEYETLVARKTSRLKARNAPDWAFGQPSESWVGNEAKTDPPR